VNIKSACCLSPLVKGDKLYKCSDGKIGPSWHCSKCGTEIAGIDYLPNMEIVENETLSS
jgi:hypothetical protein